MSDTALYTLNEYSVINKSYVLLNIVTVTKTRIHNLHGQQKKKQ